MDKPLTTLGDALANKGQSLDWRADLRAAGIERRPPPSGQARPDRGFIEQPEERVETPPPPRRRTETPSLTAGVALIRPMLGNQRMNQTEDERDAIVSTLAALSEPKSEPPKRPSERPSARQLYFLDHAEEQLPPAPSSAEPSQAQMDRLMEAEVEARVNARIAALATTGRATPPFEEDAMPRAKTRAKQSWPQETKDAAAKRCVEGPPGTQRRIAEELGTSQANVSQWVMRYREKNGLVKGPPASARPQEQTQLSRPTQPAQKAPPVSRQLATPDEAPAPPTIAVQGLEAYVAYLVDRGVRNYMRERFG